MVVCPCLSLSQMNPYLLQSGSYFLAYVREDEGMQPALLTSNIFG